MFQQQSRQCDVAVYYGPVEHGTAMMPRGSIDVRTVGQQQFGNRRADCNCGMLCGQRQCGVAVMVLRINSNVSCQQEGDGFAVARNYRRVQRRNAPAASRCRGPAQAGSAASIRSSRRMSPMAAALCTVGCMPNETR